MERFSVLEIKNIVKKLKKEYPPLESPSLMRFGGHSTSPYYCILCGMSELKIMDRKTNDGRYYCNCSYWLSPCGGEWCGWYNKKYAIANWERGCDYENFYNEAISDVLATIDEFSHKGGIK